MTTPTREEVAKAIYEHLCPTAAKTIPFEFLAQMDEPPLFHNAAEAILQLFPSDTQGEETPHKPGGFPGDIFFGDPRNSTRGTHRWSGASWEQLPSEAEVLAEMLATARTERDTWRKTAERMVEEPDALSAALTRATSAEAERDAALRERDEALDKASWAVRMYDSTEAARVKAEMAFDVSNSRATSAEARIIELEGALTEIRELARQAHDGVLPVDGDARVIEARSLLRSIGEEARSALSSTQESGAEAET